jgi:hypothetical protein
MRIRAEKDKAAPAVVPAATFSATVENAVIMGSMGGGCPEKGCSPSV